MKARLAYLALSLRDADASAKIFGDVLGLPRLDADFGIGAGNPAFAVGETALVLFEPDDPFLGDGAQPGLHHAGFAVDDPGAWAAKAGVPSGDAIGDGMVALDPADTCGLRIRLCRAAGHEAAAGPLVERVDHIGVASADNRAALDLFSDRWGFPVESQQTDLEVRTFIESFTSDKYGVVYQSRPPEPVGGLRVAFVTVGDCELEFLQNFDPSHGAELNHGSAGTTKQDQGAITRFIDRRGAGLHHLALKTPDIDRVLGIMAEAGLRMIDTVGRPGSRRARIGFVHPAAMGGLLLHFVERTEI
jgi:methylmalonyl-CoA/ethylmalonyl-CoA epimerase